MDWKQLKVEAGSEFETDSNFYVDTKEISAK